MITSLAGYDSETSHEDLSSSVMDEDLSIGGPGPGPGPGGGLGDLCDVCQEHIRKYKCPRCSLFSCSLACCKKHKVEHNCNGKRDPTSFVPLHSFKESNLRSDFHFLENVLATKHSARRTLLQGCGGERLHEKDNDDFVNNRGGRNNRKRGKGASSKAKRPIEAYVPLMQATKRRCINEVGRNEDIASVVRETKGSEDTTNLDTTGISSYNTAMYLNEVATEEDNSVTKGVGDAEVLTIPAKTRQPLDIHNTVAKKLVKACNQRKCQLMLMAPGMTKRVRNTTKHWHKIDRIDWHINCVFVATPHAADIASNLFQLSLDNNLPGTINVFTSTNTDTQQPQGELVSTFAPAVREDNSILSILNSFLDVAEDSSNVAQCHALKYIRKNRFNVLCLLQHIPSSTNQPLFYELDMDKSLRDNFEHKTIIEYPTLFFALRQDVDHLRRPIMLLDPIDENKGDIKVLDIAAHDDVIEEDNMELDVLPGSNMLIIGQTEELAVEEGDDEEIDEEEGGLLAEDIEELMQTKSIEELQSIIAGTS